MWTLDENESCEETHATFRLAGADLVPDAIERATGLTADFTAAKGETRPSGTRSVAQPIGVWTLTSKGRIESTSVERHIVYLLERLEPVKDELLAISREQGLDADFFCYWVRASDQGGPGVGPETLSRISELNAILGFDLYGPWGDD